MKNYLNFENEIKNLELELEKLKDPYTQDGLSQVNTDKIVKIENEINEKLKKNIFQIRSLANNFGCETRGAT